MLSSRRGVAPLLVSILCSTLIPHVSALTAAYCSTLNTASTGKNTSIYQSNGLCYDFCIDDYAFAVLQDNGCWCSDYVPGTTVSTSECDEDCPGYPDDSCGSKDNDLYEYLSLTLAASGTEAASSSSASSTSSSSQQPATVTETAAPVTVENTVTATPTSASETSTSAATSSTSSSSSSSSSTSSSTSTTQDTTTTTASSSTTKSSSTSSSTSTTWTPTAVVSVYTVTGKVMTVTMTPTTQPSSSGTSSTSVSNKKKKATALSTGAAVGLTVGLVALAALIGLFAFLFIRRRKQATAEEYDTVSRNDSVLVNTAGAGKPPSRSMSENSRYVLGTDGRQVVETWEPVNNRRSQLMPVDPRLNPFTPLYQRGDGSKSRDSLNTLRDDHDYSRRINQQGPILRATNPDPDP